MAKIEKRTLTMIDMKNAQWKDFSMQEAVKQGNNKKMRCTFFRVNPNDRKQELENRCIVDMPKDLVISSSL